VETVTLTQEIYDSTLERKRRLYFGRLKHRQIPSYWDLKLNRMVMPRAPDAIYCSRSDCGKKLQIEQTIFVRRIGVGTLMMFCSLECKRLFEEKRLQRTKKGGSGIGRPKKIRIPELDMKKVLGVLKG